MTTFNPKLNQYRVTQLVDLCKAREAGTATCESKTTDPQVLCSTFRSLIHGTSENQVSQAGLPSQPSNPLWRKA